MKSQWGYLCSPCEPPRAVTATFPVLCESGDIDGDGVRETIGDVLSMSCGCSIDGASPPSPTTMITSAPAPSSTVVPKACGEGDSFSISSETLPDAEGCYLDTGAETSNQKRIYSTSGTPEFGQIWMVAVDAPADAPSTAAEVSATMSMQIQQCVDGFRSSC